METENNRPLAFFEDLLSGNKLSFLKEKFINDFMEHGNTMKIESIDKELGVITYWDFFYDEIKDDRIEGVTSISFQSEFARKINIEFLKSKTKLDNTITAITLNGNNPSEYVKLQLNSLNVLSVKALKFYPKTSIIRNSINILINHLLTKNSLGHKIRNNTSVSINNPDDYSPNSFLWDSQESTLRIETLTKLFNLLTTHPKLIDSSKEDFINAFSQKTVTNGVRWCAKGKNKKTSKSSLLYFIEKLNSGYINTVPTFEVNKKVKYVFRDINGDALKNIRQSKSNISKNPTEKERIDQILFELVQ